MNYYVPQISPVSMMGSSIPTSNRIETKEDANKVFVSFYIKEIMKNFSNSNNELYGNYSNNFSKDIYNDVIVNKISHDLAEQDIFGFNKGFNNKTTASQINRTGGY